MPNHIYVDTNPYETRIAVSEDGNLAELYIERKNGINIVGNIYKGKVKNVLPGMQAAFVDIGLERNAFLYADDINLDECGDLRMMIEGKDLKTPDIRNLVHEGQEIMVQVLKEPFGAKGARITTNITIPGRKIVLMPKADYFGISRRIEDTEERERLQGILKEITPEHTGLIARTAARGVSKEELLEEVVHQQHIYEEILKAYKSGKTPSLIHSEEDLVSRKIRDLFTEEIDSLQISDKTCYEHVVRLVKKMSPKLLNRVVYFDKHYDMFSYYGLDAKIEKALKRKVWLKCGGYLIFDTAEALTVIDVNTGKYVGKNNLQETIVNTNIEAAKEIAQQIRLRDISGIIVVDFIDMEDAENREKVLNVFKEAIKKDKTRTSIMGITDLGIVEMTRKKVRQSLNSVFYGPCPYCGGEGVIFSTESMALKARKEVLRLFHESDHPYVVIKAHQAVCAEIAAKTKPDARLIPLYPGKDVYLLPCENMYIEHMECEGCDDIKEYIAQGATKL